MYRDIMINIEVDVEGGTPFVCEVQVTLAGITILKKSPLRLHSLARVASLTGVAGGTGCPRGATWTYDEARTGKGA